MESSYPWGESRCPDFTFQEDTPIELEGELTLLISCCLVPVFMAFATYLLVLFNWIYFFSNYFLIL